MLHNGMRKRIIKMGMSSSCDIDFSSIDHLGDLDVDEGITLKFTLNKWRINWIHLNYWGFILRPSSGILKNRK
jgi:hypothetical protein